MKPVRDFVVPNEYTVQCTVLYHETMISIEVAARDKEKVNRKTTFWKNISRKMEVLDARSLNTRVSQNNTGLIHMHEEPPKRITRQRKLINRLLER
jgi:hypothetical protein